MSRWYYAKDGQTKGPLSFDELQALGDRGELQERDSVFEEGASGWVPAATVSGLIRTGLVPAPPAPSPPSLPPLPEPEWDPRMTFRPNAPSATAPGEAPIAIAAVAPAPLLPPLPSTPFGTILARAFTADIGSAPVGEGEAPVLAEQGVTETTAQRYLVWRRSVLWVALVVTGVAALVTAINEIIAINHEDGSHPWVQAIGASVTTNTLRWLLFAISLLGDFVMPFVIWIAVVNWARPQMSHRSMFWGALFAFGLPMAVAMIPYRWQISVTATTSEGETIVYMSYGFKKGLQLLINLLPVVAALIGGIVAGGVRLKSLIPSVVLPGWMLLGASFFYGLILYILFVVMNSFITSPILVLSLICFTLSPLAYLVFGRVFIHHEKPNTLRSVTVARLTSFIMTLAGIVLLVIGLVTSKIGELKVVGLSSTDSFMTFWQMVEMTVTYIGRTMFITVLAVDLLLRMNVVAWHVATNFAGTSEAKEYDRVMGELQKSL